MSSSLEPIPYPDARLRSILQRVRTIAMVGASGNWNRPSYFVMKYLQEKGYRVIPVNPGLAGRDLQGERVYASLQILLTSGTTIILVEQDLSRALRVSGRVLCMLEGKIVLEGRAADLTREQVTEAYFGLGKAGREAILP